MPQRPYELSIATAARRLRDGSLTAVDLTESVLQRIIETEPDLNAYITVTDDLAIEQAALADAELQTGRDRGPLHGIPFAVKDVYDTADIITTAGSGFLRDRIPLHDAFVMTQLYEAGIVLTGKHNMHEFAAGTSSNNPHFGPVHNPWNLDYIPGGSSGGGAASILVGSCLGTLGSDTGGSIRTPASLTGVVGLKPTYGLVGRTGVLPRCWTFDTVGPLSKTVEDSALILNAIVGFDSNDPGAVDHPADDYTRALNDGLDGLRIGVPRSTLWEDCSDDVAQACQTAIDLMAAHGATVEDVDLPIPSDIDWTIVREAEAATYHGDWIGAHADEYGKEIYDNLMRGSSVPATAYINEQRARRQISADVTELLQTTDLLISPTNHSTAIPIDGPEPGFAFGRYTSAHNLTGIPSISIPCGFDPNGLPIGLMLASRHFDEATLLRAAHAYEQLTDWHKKRPVLAVPNP